MVIANHHTSDKGYAGASDQPRVTAHLHVIQAKMLFEGFEADFNIPSLGINTTNLLRTQACIGANQDHGTVWCVRVF
jgi:hypothetical protein